MTAAPFIVLEGIDGTGKSTQCRLLAEWLRGEGYVVAQCADPGGTALGDKLRSILLDGRQTMSMRAEVLLFMASRAELADKVIRPALGAGCAVVSDRFLVSNIVYQGYAGGLDPAEVRRLSLFATDGLEPDLSVVLDLPVERAANRRKPVADRIEGRGAEHQEKVRQGFLAEAAAHPERIRVVDAGRSVKATHLDVVREVGRVLEARPRA